MYVYTRQTDRHQPGASPTRQRRPSYHFCPDERLGKEREAPTIRKGRGANLCLRKADIFPFTASDFGVSLFLFSFCLFSRFVAKAATALPLHSDVVAW